MEFIDATTYGFDLLVRKHSCTVIIVLPSEYKQNLICLVLPTIVATTNLAMHCVTVYVVHRRIRARLFNSRAIYAWVKKHSFGEKKRKKKNESMVRTLSSQEVA